MPHKPQAYKPHPANVRRLQQQQRERQRGTSAARGYTYRWQQYRQGFLIDHPICVRCGQPVGKRGHVDHIKAVSGPDDQLFWEPTNHQTLCSRCHGIKSVEQDGALGHQPKPPEGQAGATAGVRGSNPGRSAT